MNTIVAVLPYIQILLAVLLIGGVFLQRSEAGLGSAFGDNDSFSSVKHTRRGFERVLFTSTIIVAILFIAAAIFALIIRS